MNNNAEKFDYDVVLSFAGENRSYVEDVANSLTKLGIKHFYDKDKEIELWGKDLSQHLQQTYSSRNVKHCVIFMSKFYTEKYYPSYELKSALAREIKDYGYILPVRLDDSEPPPGILHTKAFIDARNITPEELANKISEKIGTISSGTKSVVNSSSEFQKPRIPESDIDIYSETERVVEHIIDVLVNRGISLKSNKLNFVSTTRNQKNVLRVTYNNEVIYSLDVWIGGSIGDNDINFHHSYGDLLPSTNSMTAIGKIEWNKDRNTYLVHISNFSLLSVYGHDLLLTKEEIADKLWKEIVKVIERAFDTNP